MMMKKIAQVLGLFVAFLAGIASFVKAIFDVMNGDVGTAAQALLSILTLGVGGVTWLAVTTEAARKEAVRKKTFGSKTFTFIGRDGQVHRYDDVPLQVAESVLQDGIHDLMGFRNLTGMGSRLGGCGTVSVSAVQARQLGALIEENGNVTLDYRKLPEAPKTVTR